MTRAVLQLSAKEAGVLRLVVELAPCHGMHIARSSAGEFARNSVYIYLTRLTGKGFVRSTVVCRERLYEPTPLGRTMLKAFDMMLQAQERAGEP